MEHRSPLLAGEWKGRERGPLYFEGALLEESRGGPRSNGIPAREKTLPEATALAPGAAQLAAEARGGGWGRGL